MQKENNEKYHKKLKRLMDEYVNKVYDCTATFPKEEQFGTTSQLRRAALSVVLNYIEGYARQGKGELRQFLKISYGSLKESTYLVDFSHTRKYLDKETRTELVALGDQIGKMLWGILSKLT
jgi:four helix bundle protein